MIIINSCHLQRLFNCYCRSVTIYYSIYFLFISITYALILNISSYIRQNIHYCYQHIKTIKLTVARMHVSVHVTDCCFYANGNVNKKIVLMLNGPQYAR